MTSVPPPFNGFRSETGGASCQDVPPTYRDPKQDRPSVSAVIVLIQSGEELGRIELADKPIVFGRNDDCDVSIPEPSVLGYHARLRQVFGSVIVEGVNGAVFVAVNGLKATVPTPLNSGDRLRLGDWEVEIRIELSPPADHSSPPISNGTDSGPENDEPTLGFGLRRLMPLLVCCLLFGWGSRALIPGRDFVNFSLIPVLMLALPALLLSAISGTYFIRPKTFPVRQVSLALCFTMVAGIAVVTGWNKMVALVHEPGLCYVLMLEMVMNAVCWAIEAMQSESIFERLIGFAAGFGVWAEMVKLLPLFCLVFMAGKSGRALNYRGFLAVGFFSGLGFGIVEALINYAPWGWTPEARDNITQWFSDVPAHAFCTLIGAAVIWLAAPMITRAKNAYRRIGLCAAVTGVFAVVRAVYIVLCGLPLMGLAITGLLLIVTWWTVKTVDRKAPETASATLGGESDVLGVMSWVNSYETGSRSLRRLYITAGVMIIASMLFSSESERPQQPFMVSRLVNVGWTYPRTAEGTQSSSARPEMPLEGESWTSPGSGMEFVWVDALMMWVGKFEVTNDEYCRKEAEHSSEDFRGHLLDGARQPVVRVNFGEAAAYAEWLTERDKSSLGGMRYRLPTEAEWMSFAQCGDGRLYPWGNTMPPRYGNYGDEVAERELGLTRMTGVFSVDDYDDGFAVSCPVDQSGMNPWGLYGVGGNVWECCVSSSSLSFGAWRGASYGDGASLLRCGYRLGGNESEHLAIYGFRLVLTK